MLAINCAYVRRKGATLYFSADSKAESVLTRQRKDALADALSAHFGERLSVDIAIDDTVVVEKETPVQEESRKSDEQYEAARASLESDPNVKTLKDMFGAELKTDSIEPINSGRSD